MKQVLLERYGSPEDAVCCREVPDPGAPSAGQVVFDVLAFPINPADLSMCRGTYRLRPTLPAGIGAECVGRVTAVGGGVSHVEPGDLVINLQRENWTQRRRVAGDDVIPVPAGLDLLQAAMLRINPPTALLLLTDVVELRPGDWIIQNVANSAVGRFVIRLGRARGVRPGHRAHLNVRRRERRGLQLRLDERRGSGDAAGQADRGGAEPGGLHPGPRARPALPRPGPRDLRRAGGAGARGRARRAGRARLPDRGDPRRGGPRRARPAPGQDPGRAEWADRALGAAGQQEKRRPLPLVGP